MIGLDEEQGRDLSRLGVSPAGCLVATGDAREPYRTVGPGGEVVEPVSGFPAGLAGDFYIDSTAADVLVHNCMIPANGSSMSTNDALDKAESYLGEGYTEPVEGLKVAAVTYQATELVLYVWATRTLPEHMAAAHT